MAIKPLRTDMVPKMEFNIPSSSPNPSLLHSAIIQASKAVNRMVVPRPLSTLPIKSVFRFGDSISRQDTAYKKQ
jgi:hypothetical protein